MNDKFKPDVAKILRETTPEKVAERRRTALAGLDAAGGDRPSAPSPWAKDAPDEVDQAALPSAARPMSDDAATFEVPKKVPSPKARLEAARRSWKVVLACAAIALAAPVAVVLLGPKDPGKSETRASAGSPELRPTSEPRASASGPQPRASESAGEPRAPASPPTPSATATVGAARPPITMPKPLKPRGTPDDPHDAAAPVPTVVPSETTSSEPPPKFFR